LDEYHVVASGGSSGHRGVFVYGWDAWAICWASMVRFPQRDWATDPTLKDVPRVAAVVAASKATHVSAAFRQTFSTGHIAEHLVPVGQPLERIAASLTQLQPTELIGSQLLAAPSRTGSTSRPAEHLASTGDGHCRAATSRGPRSDTGCLGCSD